METAPNNAFSGRAGMRRQDGIVHAESLPFRWFFLPARR
jgi:hypothetical protein